MRQKFIKYIYKQEGISIKSYKFIIIEELKIMHLLLYILFKISKKLSRLYVEMIKPFRY